MVNNLKSIIFQLYIQNFYKIKSHSCQHLYKTLIKINVQHQRNGKLDKKHLSRSASIDCQFIHLCTVNRELKFQSRDNFFLCNHTILDSKF